MNIEIKDGVHIWMKVVNAILDGSDYVMLSAESAIGLYPVECVDMMKHIIKFTEGAAMYKKS